jgi:hypothetical protein
MTEAGPQAEVRRLRDRFAVGDLADRYLLALDEGTFTEKAARSIFTEDAEFLLPAGDHRGITGLTDFTDGFMSYWALTHHLCSAHSVKVDGDQASIAWNVIATHLHKDSPPVPAPSRFFQYGGRFSAVAVRTDDGWRLRKIELWVRWAAGEGNPAIERLWRSQNQDRKYKCQQKGGLHECHQSGERRGSAGCR